MSSRRKSDGQRTGTGRAWPLVVAAAAAFCLLATMPLTLPLLHLQIQPTAAKSSRGVVLLPAPRTPARVSLPAVAQPIDPSGKPSSLPAVNGTREAAAVSAEDTRIRAMLHNAAHTYQPEVIPTRGALPTLVLTARQGSYTAADLVQYGALAMLPDHAALLLDNVFVSTNAQLTLGSARLRTLYMDNGSGGFATIVAWGGNLTFHGSAAQPMTIMGWDRTADAPAADAGNGRSYIRQVGGTMKLSDVRVAALGFWSGRTGGVAWTGVTASPSKGGATGTTFTDSTYGAFVSRGSGVTFRDDLFEYNDLDGLHIHRYSVGSSVISSSASRNGGNGFVVSPATRNTLLEGDVSEHNAGNGYFLNGKPLATGASASGGSVAPGSGTVLAGSAALNNDEIGILIEGGTDTVIKGDEVCASVTAVAVRYDVTDAILTGNDIRCAPRSGLSIGPATPGLMISGNTIVGPRTGILVSNSGSVELDNNRITGATIFGVSARGMSSAVKGVGNVISGTGFRAIDARADASMPALSATDASGWQYHGRVSFWSYLRFHPLAALWLGILILVLLAWAWSHRRQLPRHPYPASTHWRDDVSGTAAADPALAPGRRPPPLRSGPLPAASPRAGPGVSASLHRGRIPAETHARAREAALTEPFPALTEAERPDSAVARTHGQRSDGSRPPVAGHGWYGNHPHAHDVGGYRQQGNGHQSAEAGRGRHENGRREPSHDYWPQDSDYQAAGSLVGLRASRRRHGADRPELGNDPANRTGGEEQTQTPPWAAAAPPDNSLEYFDAFSPRSEEVDEP